VSDRREESRWSERGEERRGWESLRCCDGAIEDNSRGVHRVRSCGVRCRSCGGQPAGEGAIAEVHGAQNPARVSGGVRHARGAAAPGRGRHGGGDACGARVRGRQQTEDAPDVYRPPAGRVSRLPRTHIAFSSCGFSIALSVSRMSLSRRWRSFSLSVCRNSSPLACSFKSPIARV
jgi:hypothetical protein